MKTRQIPPLRAARQMENGRLSASMWWKARRLKYAILKLRSPKQTFENGWQMAAKSTFVGSNRAQRSVGLDSAPFGRFNDRFGGNRCGCKTPVQQLPRNAASAQSKKPMTAKSAMCALANARMNVRFKQIYNLRLTLRTQ